MRIAYYVSNHGFGHISRSYEIIKYFLEKKEIEAIFVNTKRKSFVGNYEYKNLFFREVETDVGVIQNNSLSLDVTKTLESILNFEKGKTSLFEQEIDFLEKEKIDIVISDASSFPFTISNKLKLPSFCISNFTWDFIYDNYKDFNPHFERYSKSLSEEYSLCKLGLVLPFFCPMDSIKKKKEVGIIGRSSSKDKKDIRKALDFKDGNRYFLFSFGAYGITEEINDSNLAETDWIVTSGYEKLKGKKIIDIKGVEYPEIVRACDFVLTKPGYGILAETYLGNTPVIYTDRGDFAEYSYLVSAMQKYHYSAYISQQELFNLNLDNAIQVIEKEKYTRNVGVLIDGKDEIFSQIF